MRLRSLALAVVMFAAAPAFADEFDGKKELTTDEKANIDADRDEAHAKIEEKYKDDDSMEARHAKQKEMQEADDQVLEKHGTNNHDYAAAQRHRSMDDTKAETARTGEVKEQRKKDKEEAEKKKAEEANAEPQVVKGFDEEHPLDMSAEPEKKEPAAKPQYDADGNLVPAVEKLDPKDDPNAGAAGDDAAAAAAPPPSGGRHGGGHHGKKSKSADY
ncbi:MAG: hypothetical protein JST54_04390 [Deltaproteobacteria bacterium]|nr:hypothetical protein [Deltaproteobacteria bacterium]